MAEIARITPEETKRRMDSGQAILVCAYESDDKYESVKLDGSISLNEFKQHLPDMPQEQEIVFYCQ